MRVVLVGAAADRARLRAQLQDVGIEVAGEYPSLSSARASGVNADAIMLAAGPAGLQSKTRPTGPEGEALVEPLTLRELDVLAWLAEGLSNKSIAARLGISDQTVKFHVASIAGKLGAANRTDIVRRAVRRGLIAL